MIEPVPANAVMQGERRHEMELSRFKPELPSEMPHQRPTAENQPSRENGLITFF